MQIGQVLPLIGDPSLVFFFVFLSDNLISWKSKETIIVARSRAEAEFRVMATATCQIVASRPEIWGCFTDNTHLRQ